MSVPMKTQSKLKVVLQRLALVLVVWLLPCQKKAFPGRYDLVAASVTVKPAVVHVGDEVILDYIVRNDGKDTVPGRTYHVDLFIDGRRASFDHGTSRIEPGSTIAYSKAAGYHHLVPDKPGKYRYRLEVDANNNLFELDESNNVLEGDIEVLP